MLHYRTVFGDNLVNEVTRRERRSNIRQSVLQTALALINEKGLDKLSLREIARRVDFSPAGLYEYFDGKDDILRALAREADARLYGVFERVPYDLPAKERLLRICLAYVDFVVNSSAYFVVMDNVPSSYTSFDEPVPTQTSYFLFLQAVQNAIENGDIQPRDDFGRESIIYSLWALIHGMGTLKLTRLRDFDANFDAADRRALEIFVTSLK